MTTPMRSATVLMQKALSEPETLKALSADPEKTLKDLERQVVASLPLPNDEVVGRLWLIIVSTFSLVLIGTTGVLGAGVFFPKGSGEFVVPGQVMLTVFSTVVGFLAGLLAPSPMGRQSA